MFLNFILFVDINFKDCFKEDAFVNERQNGAQSTIFSQDLWSFITIFVLTDKEFRIPKRLSN